MLCKNGWEKMVKFKQLVISKTAGDKVILLLSAQPFPSLLENAVNWATNLQCNLHSRKQVSVETIKIKGHI